MVPEPDAEKRQKLERAAVLAAARRIATLTGASPGAAADSPASRTPPRSIFKAKTTPEPSLTSAGQAAVTTLPQAAGGQSVAAPPSPPGPATPQTLGAGAGLIQIPASNGSMSLSPTATLVFGSHEEKLEYTSASTLSFKQLVPSALASAQSGDVIFYVPVSWSFPPAGNRPADAPLVGTALAHVRVPFSVAPDKDKPDRFVITWQAPRTMALSSDGAGASLTGAPVTTDLTPDGGAATITPSLQFQEQLAHATTHGSVTMSHATTATVSAGFLGTGGSMAQTEQVTHDLSPGNQDQTQVSVTDSFSMSFTANLILPKPEEVATTATLEVRFAVNSDSTASGGEEEKITTWYQTLDKKVRNSIESGKTKINLLGKASATASFEHNRKLAERRVQKVKEILSDLAGSDAQFHTQAIGRSQAQKQGEAAEERVVLVSLGDNRPPAVPSDQPSP